VITSILVSPSFAMASACASGSDGSSETLPIAGGRLDAVTVALTATAEWVGVGLAGGH
jgi:hypothetical protein